MRLVLFEITVLSMHSYVTLLIIESQYLQVQVCCYLVLILEKQREEVLVNTKVDEIPKYVSIKL